LRYYYATKLNSRVEDVDLSLDDFVQRVNADLVNKIANIPSRVLAILHRHCDGQLGSIDAGGRELLARLRGRCDEVATSYENREYAQVTRCIGDMTAEINAYIHEHKPWEVVQEHPQLATTVCTVGLNAFKIVATLLAPILPAFAAKVAKMLKLPSLAWDHLDVVLENQPVEPYERLVDRVDRKQANAMIEASGESTAEEVAEAPTMTLDGLVDCDFQTMRLAEANPVLESDTLVALRFDSAAGERELVAGLGYSAVERGLVGKHFLVLANVQPKTIRGHDSHGMIIAAEVDGQPVPVLVPDNQRNSSVE
jgi:methionyl-tRNA synthetase